MSSSIASSMSASAAAHEGSASANASMATRVWLLACVPMRSMMPRSFGSSWWGYNRRVVLATLTMRSALRSNSCATRITVTRKRRSVAIGCWRASRRKMRSSIGVGELVDDVVGFDDPFGGGEIAVEQGLRTAGDRLGGERGETDDVDPQLVEILVERLPRVFGCRFFRHWCNRHDASTWAEGGLPMMRPACERS